MTEVVKAGLEDYIEVYKLAGEIWEPTYREILSKEQIEYMFEMMYSRDAYTRQITESGHNFLLLKEHGRSIAFASYQLDYNPGATKIHKLYLLPETQGRGIGKIFLAAIEELALANGNDKITLNVNRYNPAVHFYLSTGFVKVAEEDINIGNDYLMEDFVMEKSLRD